MKTKSSQILLQSMTEVQRSVLIELERQHDDLIWEGGGADTRPLRVSLKSLDGHGVAAFNTRARKCFLRLEFRGRDYDGVEIIHTGHRDFDRASDLVTRNDVTVASRIIGAIKKNYS